MEIKKLVRKVMALPSSTPWETGALVGSFWLFLDTALPATPGFDRDTANLGHAGGAGGQRAAVGQVLPCPCLSWAVGEGHRLESLAETSGCSPRLWCVRTASHCTGYGWWGCGAPGCQWSLSIHFKTCPSLCPLDPIAWRAGSVALVTLVCSGLPPPALHCRLPGLG